MSVLRNLSGRAGKWGMPKVGCVNGTQFDLRTNKLSRPLLNRFLSWRLSLATF